MKVAAAAKSQPAPGAIGGRIQLLDDIWVLTLLAVLIATAAPRLLSAFDFEFGAVVWGLLGLGAVHVALAVAAERERARGAWSSSMLLTIHAAGVMLVGVVWYYAGGMRNPLFLLAFVLPVIGASVISRWQPYLTAALGIVVAATVALRQTPELRWYAAGLDGAGAWLATQFSNADSGTTAPFAGFYAPSGYFVVTLAVFAILLCACAVAAEFLAALFMRLHQRANLAREEAELAQELWIQLIRNLPVPAILVEVEARQLVCRSDCWAASFGAPDAPNTPATGDLFGMVQFSYPEVVEELIAGEGGSVRPCMFRRAGQLRAAEIHVQPILHLGRRLALVIMADVTESFCVQSALDAADYAAVVVDSEERVMGLNKPARGLFADIKPGMAAFPLLGTAAARKGWWDPGLRGRCRSQAEIHGRVYDVHSSSVAMPGEERSVYVIAISPAAKGHARDYLAAGKVGART